MQLTLEHTRANENMNFLKKAPGQFFLFFMHTLEYDSAVDMHRGVELCDVCMTRWSQYALVKSE